MSPIDPSSVSVVIPCFNRERQVVSAVESVMAQSVKVGEIIVVDDGSTDGTARAAASCGPSVTVLSIENTGGSGARNQGIEAARGKWIAFLDSDDVWAPDKIELQLEAARRFPQCGLVFCDQAVHRGSETLIESRFALGGVLGYEQSREGPFLVFDGRRYFETLLIKSRIFTSSVMARRDLPSLRFPEGYQACQDWPVWLRLSLETSFCAVAKTLVHMESGQDQITSSRSRLAKYRVRAIRDLMTSEVIPELERSLLGEELAKELVGAAYFALRSAEPSETRFFLKQVRRKDFGYARLLAYWLLSYCPLAVRRMVARRDHG